MDFQITKGRDYVLACGKIAIGDHFFLDTHRLKNYSYIYNYLFNHKESIKAGVYPHKGLWLAGMPGGGKSAAFKVMNQMIIQSYLPQSDRFQTLRFEKLKDIYQSHQDEFFDFYGKGSMRPVAIDEIFYSDGVAVGDYKKAVVLTDLLIFERCELFVEEGIKTHIGSNLMRADVKKHNLVNPRCIDRFDEMFNEIYWHGESLRPIIDNLKIGGDDGK